MKKGLIATALSLGMFLTAKAPLTQNSKIDSFEKYNHKQENFFLETDSFSYHPFEASRLHESGIEYKLVKTDTVDYSKIPSRPNYLNLNEVRGIIDFLYKQTWAPKIVSADQYEKFILKESSLNANSYNKGSGASGLSQMRRTAWEDSMPLSNYLLDRFNPAKSLEAGARYVSWLEKTIPKLNSEWKNLSQDEKVRGIIQGYNFGIGNMINLDWNSSKVPLETSNYEKFVMGNKKI